MNRGISRNSGPTPEACPRDWVGSDVSFTLTDLWHNKNLHSSWQNHHARWLANSNAQMTHNWGIVLYIIRSLQMEEDLLCFGLHIAELQSWTNSSATIHTWSQLNRVLRDWVHLSFPGMGFSPEFLTQASVEMRTWGIFPVLGWIRLALSPRTNFMTLLPLSYNHVMCIAPYFDAWGCYKARNSLAT
jgi:hypothetical protein